MTPVTMKMMTMMMKMKKEVRVKGVGLREDEVQKKHPCLKLWDKPWSSLWGLSLDSLEKKEKKEKKPKVQGDVAGESVVGPSSLPL